MAIYTRHKLVIIFIFVLAAETLLRLFGAALIPLTEDEAYYRLWSFSPRFGYFDHPPMIAWWIWLGRWVCGDTPLGVRLAPIMGCAATTLFTVDLARLAGSGRRAALRAGVWLNATLLIGLGGLLAVPDAPNTLFWTVSVWCAFRAKGGRAGWWIGCGLAAGLACLSKYSALFLAPGLLLWLLLEPDGRRELKRPWPWIAGLVALAVFAPNIAWNAAHHWQTFAKQFGRVRADGFAPQHLPELLVDQALLLNPLIALFVARALAWREPRRLLAMAAPFAAYLLLHSLHDAVQGQWPAPLYPIAVIAAARAADRDWRPRLAWARAATPVVGLGIGALAIAFVSAPLDGRMSVRDPAAPLRGWTGFSAAVDRTRRGAGAAWVGAASYGLTAQLAAGAAAIPAVEIRERERYLFTPPAAKANFTRPGLIVDPPSRTELAALRRCFAAVSPLPPLRRGLGSSATIYAAYVVSEPRRDVERKGC
jgi:4-amino-4-deoxy-L-arabinose transferase-like glycosyltransferase